MPHKQSLAIEKLFQENRRLWDNLKGEWNTYLYPSVYKKESDIHLFKTYFKDDYEVIDYHENRGRLFMGENQSLIVKKTPNEKNFSVIVFQNIEVTYQIIKFAIISIQNGTNKEMMQYGFYSRKEYSQQEAKEILGDIESVQLKLDMGFSQRILDEFVVK